jgi:hypothetical protein
VRDQRLHRESPERDQAGDAQLAIQRERRQQRKDSVGDYGKLKRGFQALYLMLYTKFNCSLTSLPANPVGN